MIPGLELALEYDQNIILESEIGGIITALLSPLCQACFLSSQNNNKPEGDVCRVCISISAFHKVMACGLCLGLFPCSCVRIVSVSVASVKVEYKREGARTATASGKGAMAAESDCCLLFPGKPEANPTNS